MAHNGDSMASKNSKVPTNIALVDFRLTGHHSFYLASFAKAFTDLGCEVHIFTCDTAKCFDTISAAIDDLSFCIDNIHLSKASLMTKRILGCRSFFRLKQLENDLNHVEETKNIEFDLVYFPYIDDLVQFDLKYPYWFQKPFKRQFSGLLMEPRTRLLNRPKGILKHLTTTWLEETAEEYQELHLLVEDVLPEVRNLLCKTTIHFPDFCSNPGPAPDNDPLLSKIDQRRNNRTLTSLLGSIHPYKSIDLFLDIVEAADPTKHFFVIAGKIWKDKLPAAQKSQLESHIKNETENLIILDQWIPSESVFDGIVARSDLLFAYYRNFKKSSNILSKAAFYGKPCIVSDKYLMGNRVNKYQLGYALSELHAVKLYKKGHPTHHKFDPNLLEQYNAQHSYKNVENIFRSLLQQSAQTDKIFLQNPPSQGVSTTQ